MTGVGAEGARDASQAGDAHDPQAALAGMEGGLPAPPKPLGAYVPVHTVGDMLYTSGMLPIRDGAVAYAGRVGQDLTVAQGAEAAELCARNAVAAIAAALGGVAGLRRVRRVVQVTAHVLCGPDFTDQPAVADGASNWLAAVFGERGRHTRLALGASALPKGAAVELALVLAIEPDARART